MPGKLYFGVDLQQKMQAWMDGPFGGELSSRYGNYCMLASVILDSTAQHDWHSPLNQLAVCLKRGSAARIGGAEGLLMNVDHKLRFCLRTGLNSSEARLRPDLIEPGDFPYEGAGFYRGYVGGLSGLDEEQDWWAWRRIVDHYIELRAEAALPAVAASKARKPGMKYLNGEIEADPRWDLAEQ